MQVRRVDQGFAEGGCHRSLTIQSISVGPCLRTCLWYSWLDPEVLSRVLSDPCQYFRFCRGTAVKAVHQLPFIYELSLSFLSLLCKKLQWSTAFWGEQSTEFNPIKCEANIRLVWEKVGHGSLNACWLSASIDAWNNISFPVSHILCRFTPYCLKTLSENNYHFYHPVSSPVFVVAALPFLYRAFHHISLKSAQWKLRTR